MLSESDFTEKRMFRGIQGRAAGSRAALTSS